jgi:hypothetical protein
MNRNDASLIFGSANIEKLRSFKIDGGDVDFGDELHLLGSPQGNAIVVWSTDGRVAVKGKLYSDNFGAQQEAIVEIQFRRTDGRLTRPFRRSVVSQGLLSSMVVEKVSPTGSFNEAIVRLIKFQVDTGLTPVAVPVTERTFRR